MHKVALALVVSVALLGCASSPEQTASSATKKGGEPVWVSSPKAAYPDALYASAVGSGADRESAEKNALGALVAVFGQRITGETVVSSRYTEAVRAGTIDVSENTDVGRSVLSSYDLQTVVGADVREVWDDGKGTIWAVAVMDKGKAGMIYADLVDTNEASIRKLTSIPDSERNTLDAYARYGLAAEVADTNATFLNVLSVVSPGSAAARRQGAANAGVLRATQMNIAESIPIKVTIANDRDGRIAAAFSAAIAKAGFKQGGDGSRYALEGTLALSEVDLPKNPNKFVRYQIDSALRDTRANTSLIPYSINGREGHTSQSEAEHRALRVAEQKIRDDFGGKLNEYLGKLSGS